MSTNKEKHYINLMNKSENNVNHLVDKYFKYDPDTGKLYHTFQRPKVILGSEAGSTTRKGYIYIKIHGRGFMAHRLAWRLFYGKWPSKFLDHKNGVKTDNRIINLREVDRRKNSHNTISTRSGKLVGTTYVEKSRNFIAKISQNKKCFYLGAFPYEVMAHNQYYKALLALQSRHFKSAKELREYIKKMK